VLPAEIVAEVVQLPPEGQFAPLAAASEKSVPVPVSPTDCGLSTALSVNINDAVSAPVVLGVNVTLTEQVALTAMVAPLQLLVLIAKSPALAPLIATPLIVRPALPLFVTITLIAELFTVSC
jgi:hypothetical protein